MDFTVALNDRQRPTLAVRASLSNDTVLAGLTGVSGAGKTTLLRALAGLEPRAQVTASWRIAGELRVGMVFQQPALFPHLNVSGNLKLAQHYAGRDVDAQRIVSLCCCAHLLDKPCQALSGGEAQRVALARALINHPDILLLDEAFSAIDIATRRQILDALYHYLDEHSITAITVSHDTDELALYTDEVFVLDDGQLHRSDAGGARAQDFAVLEGEPLAPDPRYPYHRLSVEGHTLYTRQDVMRHGRRRMLVAARRVSLDTGSEARSSQVNALRCQVASMQPGLDGEVCVRLRCGTNQLCAIISQLSVDRLALHPGMTVMARFKLC
ncbi:ATP-binding cassette domain-containing protein [Alteromonas sp. CYL-A6]|uniref:ATP-binding cassette domain-containing protein n=1 Tax=Alteromonas nitratireducens TaxID=3390813 RepID=UPI0034BE67BF